MIFLFDVQLRNKYDDDELSASWSVGELDCRRVGVLASWFVGEMSIKRSNDMLVLKLFNVLQLTQLSDKQYHLSTTLLP